MAMVKKDLESQAVYIVTSLEKHSLKIEFNILDIMNFKI